MIARICRLLLPSVLAALSLLLLAGCGGPESIVRGTPDATAKAFIDAMKAGDYQKVANGFEFESYARRENPDWDTFGESQRRLIVASLQEAKAAELASLSGMFTGDVSVGEVTRGDGRAQVMVTAGATTLALHMTQLSDGWHLRRIEESAGQ